MQVKRYSYEMNTCEIKACGCEMFLFPTSWLRMMDKRPVTRNGEVIMTCRRRLGNWRNYFLERDNSLSGVVWWWEGYGEFSGIVSTSHRDNLAAAAIIYNIVIIYLGNSDSSNGDLWNCCFIFLLFSFSGVCSLRETWQQHQKDYGYTSCIIMHALLLSWANWVCQLLAETMQSSTSMLDITKNIG